MFQFADVYMVQHYDSVYQCAVDSEVDILSGTKLFSVFSVCVYILCV